MDFSRSEISNILWWCVAGVPTKASQRGTITVVAFLDIILHFQLDLVHGPSARTMLMISRAVPDKWW